MERDVTVDVTWRWFVGSSDVSSSTDPRMSVSSVDGALTIRSVRNTDIGRYSCFVISVAGNDSASAELEVIGIEPLVACYCVFLYKELCSVWTMCWPWRCKNGRDLFAEWIPCIATKSGCNFLCLFCVMILFILVMYG